VVRKVNMNKHLIFDHAYRRMAGVGIKLTVSLGTPLAASVLTFKMVV
jgi:hypothetical protein